MQPQAPWCATPAPAAGSLAPYVCFMPGRKYNSDAKRFVWLCIGQGYKLHSLLCAAAQRGERRGSPQQARQTGVSAAQGAFRLGVFSSATQRTVSAVLPMLEAAAVAGGGPSAPLFSDRRLVLPNVTMWIIHPFPFFCG